MFSMEKEMEYLYDLSIFISNIDPFLYFLTDGTQKLAYEENLQIVLLHLKKPIKRDCSKDAYIIPSVRYIFVGQTFRFADHDSCTTLAYWY